MLLALAAGVSCARVESEAAAGGGGKGPPAAMVTVAAATQAAVPIEVEAIGNVEAYRTVQLKSMVDGQIVNVRLEQGQDVREGEILFQLDKRPFSAELGRAEGALAKDEATAWNSHLQAERNTRLMKENIVALNASQQQEAQARADAAAVQADKAAVESAKVSLGYTDIRAPIDARAGAILVNKGNTIKANDANPLVTLNQVTPIYVQFSIPESELAAVRAKGVGKLQVMARAQNQQEYSIGTLTFIDNAVDPATGTIKLRGTFQNRDRKLWPGEFLNVKLVLGVDQRATVVPATAVQTSQQGRFVFVVQKDDTAVMRPVSSSRTYGQVAVIDTGVNAGERVIVDGQLAVIPNSKVNVVRTVSVPSTKSEQVAEASGASGATGARQ